MSKCYGGDVHITPGDPCVSAAPACGKAAPAAHAFQAHFGRMIENCLAYAREQQAAGRPIVGIMCEYTPRELLMAAGAVPVCLCGGSAATIPAAEEHLPANLCPLVKSTYGYFARQSNPFLEMADLVVAETTCDAKKKMYELMAARKEMYILELPQKQGRPEALDYWENQLRAFLAFLEARYGRAITDDALRAAICVMNRERALRRELAALMQRAEPPFTSHELLAFKSSISGLEADFAQYERAIAYYHDPSDLSDPSDPGQRTRVLLTGVPMPHGAERVLDIIEASGGLVVCMENCTGVKPIIEDVDEYAPDPLRALAAKYYHLPCSVMTPNTDRIESLRRLAAEYRPDCIIELVWQACLTYDVESFHVRRFAIEELGLPYLRLETDYSPSDSARIAVRVEALFETAKARA